MFDNKKNQNEQQPSNAKKSEYYDAFDIKEQNESHLYRKPYQPDPTVAIQDYEFGKRDNLEILSEVLKKNNTKKPIDIDMIKTIDIKDIKEENKLVALKNKRKNRDKVEFVDESTISGRNIVRMRLETNPYFIVSGVTKEFGNGSGVKNISFSIKKGEMVGFIGDNGTGKTTTIKLIFNELKKDSGFVSLEGKQLNEKNALSRIAFFPDQNNYPKNFNIVQFAYYSAMLKGVHKKELDKYINLYLEALTLKPYAKNKFSDLSAGMQKKALLLSVLVTNPEIIILDEPTANLDVYSRLEFMGVLKHLSKEHNKTIIITSHNIDELNNSVNRAILLKKQDGYGQLVYDEYFDVKNEDLRKIYIKVVGREIKGIDYDKIKEVEDEKYNAKYEEVFGRVLDENKIKGEK
ncbi:ABC transporter ATP-binding protein [Spiroplasma sp. TIUS-1]|uniref:ABC transporter ATP-binding protein n=1 Tax=Spiroplasma sp. TIUS-1 TaxID=216963 RepID=UPI0013978F40|nr:ABC transporter ATP-binding protein [Spiroplasma sp. TIUS-1]QHX36051.1 ABC transporter ATP-binding protein [Spiroplasma sp. TIUS-1]